MTVPKTEQPAANKLVNDSAFYLIAKKLLGSEYKAVQEPRRSFDLLVKVAYLFACSYLTKALLAEMNQSKKRPSMHRLESEID